MKVRVVVLARAPSAGKTRLANDVGRDLTTRLAQAFLVDTFEGLRTHEGYALALSTPDPGADWGFLGDVEVWPQTSGSLGVRMSHASQRALETCPLVVLMGGDSPGLPASHVPEVVAGLGTHDVVLGPTMDGGFWAMGVHAHWGDMLEGVPWSTAEAFDATCAAFQRGGYSVGIGPGWWDVDRAVDLDRLWGQRATLRMPATLDVLGKARDSGRPIPSS
jgi:glycosyltransferase A (GT-A) superfamily protein (DUF2064 family)